jgi:predicted DNA-binding WGR domain protein
VLELVDPEATSRRRCRFYTIHVQPNLFDGAVDLVRTWGRIGPVHRPRHLYTSLPDLNAAHVAIRPVLARRLRRGYRSSAPK